MGINYINFCNSAEVAPVNLELPKIKFNQAKVPVAVPSEPKIRFAEKTASSSLSTFSVKREPGESEFKKRKIGEDGKKNLRTRESDD